jgi:two-component system, cell cycle response regulator
MSSVRTRLALVLGVVLIVPAIIAVVVMSVLAPRQATRAAAESSARVANGTSAVLVEQCRSIGESARSLALQAALPDLAAAARSAISRQPDAFAAVVKDGRVVASAGTVPGLSPSQLVDLSCSRRQGTGQAPGQVAGDPVLAEVVPATGPGGTSLGTVVVGRVLDSAGLQSLAREMGMDSRTALALACPGGRGASTVEGEDALLLRQAAAAGALTGERSGWQVSTADGTSGQFCAVAAAVPTPGSRLMQGTVLGILLAGLLIGFLMVLWLAQSLTSPVLALTKAAERVARGDLTGRLPAGSADELGRLSGAFNHMSDELQLSIGELHRSRDLLRENVARLGDALQRTHDLDGLLSTVLAAAASATSGQRATAWLIEGGSVVARVSVPSGAPRATVRRLPIGADLAGEVAADGQPRRLGHGHEDGTTVLGGPALGAPLRRGHSVLGVIVVERDPQEPAFDTDDEAMLVSLAGPAGIAVDNVLLHREAQRLSVTDPLTGAGNLRHMTTTLAREVERATRFDRPLALLLMDLDHFKRVNDTYGHTVGDAVLRELSRRVAACVREVDTVARYGGEEFVVITPETDTDGALSLAARICEAIREAPFVVGEDNVIVTVSIGVASLPAHGTSSGDLVRAADDGLYAAKRAGRDRFQLAPLPGSATTAAVGDGQATGDSLAP